MVKWMNFCDENVFLGPNFARNWSEVKKNLLSGKISPVRKTLVYTLCSTVFGC